MTYGDANAVTVRLSVESVTVESELITAALDAADAWIESNIKKNRLPLPPAGSSTIITQAATFYAVADTLEPFFNSTEDENKKSEYYLERANELLNDYITAALDQQAINGTVNSVNPYSSSQSPIRLGGDLDDRWGECDRRY